MPDPDQGCTKRRYEISSKDLPLCCPLPNQRVWDAHPRVYLPVEKTGHAVCPYCESEFSLKDFQDDAA